MSRLFLKKEAIAVLTTRSACSMAHGRSNVAFGVLFKCAVGFVHSQG